MATPVRIAGLAASAGFAQGPIYLARPAAGIYQAKASPEEEVQALMLAVEAAASGIADAMAALAGDAAEILEFQLAMLEDGTFTEAAIEAMGAGVNAYGAWKAVLDQEITAYQTSDDAYFTARAADLADIRDSVLSALTGDGGQRIPAGAIYVDRDIPPSRFLAHDWNSGGGLALREGSVTSHVAMLARARGVPAIVGIGDCSLENGTDALLDADAGQLLISPGDEERARFEMRRAEAGALMRAAEAGVDRPAVTADGETVEILVNIADPSDVERIPIAHVDGVGLMRTEFLFGGAKGLPDEETQLAAYGKVLDWAQGKPVTIRTIDAGGDKPVEGYTIAEDNAFLGVRGIRLSLEKQDIFRVQIRALLRAAAHGELKVMLPMVSVPREIDQARALFDDEARALSREGIGHAMPEIGIMVEVPSVAITPERFSAAQFFSIGSNDLTQYVLAASRDNARLAGLGSADDPAVLKLIADVAKFGTGHGIETSLCGDAASDPQLVPLLLAAGLRRLSVAPSRVALVKAAVRGFTRGANGE